MYGRKMYTDVHSLQFWQFLMSYMFFVPTYLIEKYGYKY